MWCVRARAHRRGGLGLELTGLFLLLWSERGSCLGGIVVERMDRGVLILFG